MAQIILITGASSGFGNLTACALAEAGYTVYASMRESATDAVAQIIAEHGRIDVVMHNAGHMMYGPTEAFTPEQLAQQYDTTVLST